MIHVFNLTYIYLILSLLLFLLLFLSVLHKQLPSSVVFFFPEITLSCVNLCIFVLHVVVFVLNLIAEEGPEGMT